MKHASDLLYLVVDTSIKGVALALVLRQGRGHKVVWSAIADGHFASAGKISSLLTEGLKAGQYSLEDCQVIAVSVGPGSFTGIKIGLAWCYGLFAPRQRQLRWLSLSAFDEACCAMLPRVGAETSRSASPTSTCLFLASTRTHGYLSYRVGNSPTASSCLYHVGQTDLPWGELPTALSSADIVLCGEWPMLVEQLQQYGLSWREISIRHLMEMSLQGMIARLIAIDPQELTSKLPRPRYLRQSTAEENHRGTAKHEITSS